MKMSYSDIYSREYAITKKLCFSAAMVTFTPLICISAMNAPKCDPIKLSDFSEEQLAEIEGYLKGYNEKLYVIEANERIYAIVPSFYPTSTMALFLRMDFSPSVFLRFVKDRPELFVLSESIETLPARMTPRLQRDRRDFLVFCEEMEKAFFCIDRLNLTFFDDEEKEGYCEEAVLLSNFLGVPIESVTFNEGENKMPLKSNFSLFVAFATTMFMLAKNDALDRHIKIEFDIDGGLLTAKMSFKTEQKINIANETFLWDFLASDKRMLFEYYGTDDRFYVNFQPYFKDWAYLGIKQNVNADMLFNDIDTDTTN